MIIPDCRLFKGNDFSAFAWASLRRIQNVEITAKRLMDLHKVPVKRRDNVHKQATQIRFCLIQAREYFAAAKTVSLATKPNLLYYGLMSLALAEILFKQDGNSSLDRARETNRHHGLTMTAGAIPRNAPLAESAAHLRARPIIMDGKRKGTFDLWHRSSREHPMIGDITELQPNGGSTTRYGVVLGATDTDYPIFPDTGMDLCEALSGLPFLFEEMRIAGLSPPFVRGATSFHFEPRGDITIQRQLIRLHPHPLCSAAIEKLSFSPLDFENIHCMEIGHGYQLTLTTSPVGPMHYFTLPPAATMNHKEWRMWINNPCLNEFGYFYVCLFLAGNYARYFPDVWLSDVETSSPLSLAIEQLCDLAEWRVPWLALCELDQILYVHEV